MTWERSTPGAAAPAEGTRSAQGATSSVSQLLLDIPPPPAPSIYRAPKPPALPLQFGHRSASPLSAGTGATFAACCPSCAARAACPAPLCIASPGCTTHVGGAGCPLGPRGQRSARGISRGKGAGGSWFLECWGRGLSAPHLGGPPEQRAAIPCCGCQDKIPSGCSQGQGGDAAQVPWGTICSSAVWWGHAKPLPAAVGVLPPLPQPPQAPSQAPGGHRMDPSQPGGGHSVLRAGPPQHRLG